MAIATAYFTDSAPYSKTSQGQVPSSGWEHYITLPQTRLASNGNYPMWISQARMYLAGAGSATGAILTMGGNSGTSAGEATFAVSTASSAALSEYKDVGTYSSRAAVSDTSGGKQLKINLKSTPSTSSLLVGTDEYTSANGGILINSSISYRKLWGQYSYFTVPVAPVLGSVTPDGNGLKVTWSKVTDWGDSVTSRGYRITLALTQNGTEFLQATVDDINATSYTFPEASIDPSTTYWAKVYAYNQIKELNESPMSVASNTTSGTSSARAAAPSFSGSFSNGQVGVYYNSSISVISTAGATIDAASVSETFSSRGLSVYSGGTYYSVYGYPTSSGSASISMTATDTYSQTTPFSASVTFAAPAVPSFPSTSFANGNAAQSGYSSSITASGAISISLDKYSIAGLSISSSGPTITVSGTPDPSASGQYTFQAMAIGYTDGGATNNSAWTTLSINIIPLSVPVWTDQSLESNAKVGIQYDIAGANNSVSASGATSYQVTSGALPDGLLLNSSTGAINGTPLSGGSYVFNIYASNPSGGVNKQFTINVINAGKRLSGSSYIQNSSAKVLKNGTWQNITFAKRFNGSSWENI